MGLPAADFFPSLLTRFCDFNILFEYIVVDVTTTAKKPSVKAMVGSADIHR